MTEEDCEMHYKGLVFDFDYTLGDSTDGIVICVNHALNQLGYAQAKRDLICRTIGLHLQEVYQVMVKAQGKEEKLGEEEEFSRLFIEKADRVMTENTRFFPGVLESLGQWKEQGYKLGIVTTKYRYRIEEILQKYQASNLMDAIIGADNVKRPKPDPQGLLWMASMWELPKEQLLYIGDSLVDAKTAQAAGVDFVGVASGTTTKEELQQYPHAAVFDGIIGIRELLV
jgi:phosphoglycolate phosphatase